MNKKSPWKCIPLGNCLFHGESLFIRLNITQFIYGVYITLSVFVFITIVVSLFYLQYGRDVTVETSSLNSSSEFYEQKFNVIANKLFVSNKDKFAEK